jgi:uncharacterized protein (TIGR03083 family)
VTATLAHLDVLRDALMHLDTFIERLPSKDRLDAPTALEGWTVETLVRHVAAVCWQQSEALHRSRAGITQAPAYASVDGEASALPRALRDARSYLADAVERLDGDPLVPLPFATLPASIAAFVLLIEYGVHVYDLERAIGTASGLSPSVANAVIDLMGGMLPMLASETHPGEPVSYAVDVDDGRSIRVSWNGDAWDTGPSATPDCTISGPASAVALFSLGRIGADDPSLRIGGDLELVGSFKTYFPGP